MNPKVVKLREEREKNTTKITSLQARNKKIDADIISIEKNFAFIQSMKVPKALLFAVHQERLANFFGRQKRSQMGHLTWQQFLNAKTHKVGRKVLKSNTQLNAKTVDAKCRLQNFFCIECRGGFRRICLNDNPLKTKIRDHKF